MVVATFVVMLMLMMLLFVCLRRERQAMRGVRVRDVSDVRDGFVVVWFAREAQTTALLVFGGDGPIKRYGIFTQPGGGRDCQ